jgi:hypothetical protein
MPSTTSSRNPIPRWFKPRGYLHFDHKVSKQRALAYVTQPQKIEHHAFFPFLAYTKSTPRYKPVKKKVEPKNRDIYYAAHLDSHIYAYYAYVLGGLCERALKGTPAENSVLAYRTLGRSNIDFAYEAFNEIAARAPCVAIALDLSQFFDTLDHTLLKDAWCRILESNELPRDHYAVYKSLTKFSYVGRDAVFDEFAIPDNSTSQAIQRICSPEEFRTRVRTKGLIQRNKKAFGIPQGSPISAVLSNLYMLELDQHVSVLAQQHGASYRRYCDDILIICPYNAQSEVEQPLRNFLKSIKLKINDDKTERSTFQYETTDHLVASAPLQYLGFTFNGERILVRSSSVARYYRKMKFAVRFAAKAAKNNQRHPRIYKDKLYTDYTHLGRKNFFSYVKRASRSMQMPSVMQQLARHWKKLHTEIDKRSIATTNTSATSISASHLAALIAADDGSLTGSTSQPINPTVPPAPELVTPTTGSMPHPHQLDIELAAGEKT